MGEPSHGIEASREVVAGLLEVEAGQVGHDRCVLAGFSQGGALALYVGLQWHHRLAGLVAMSSYLPKPHQVKVSEEAREIPVLQCHGVLDSMVELSNARAAEKFMAAQGIHKRTFHLYPDLDHSANDQ